MSANTTDLIEALKKIASIENKCYGGDWDEIELAREIASDAIAKTKGDGMSNKEFINSIETFMKAAGHSTEGFNVRQAALYTGLQCEELAEKLASLGLEDMALELDALGRDFKIGNLDDIVDSADPEALLDADIDLAVVSIGSAYSMGADVLGAAGEVCRANLDKAGPDGKIARDENGKAMKPDGWEGPELLPFLAK